MFHRLFTGKSQGYAQLVQDLDKRVATIKALIADAEGLRKRVTRLEIELGELKDLHDALDSRHAKLSGVVHGRRGGRGNTGGSERDSLEAIPTGDKDALRARAGLRAGIRFNHSEGE